MENQTKKILIALGVLFAIISVVVIGYGILSTNDRQGKFATHLSLLPEDTIVTLNGVTVSGDTLYLKPGHYTVRGTKNGFSDFTNDIYIQRDNQTITVSPVPVSDEAKQWAKDHETDYQAIEGIAGAAANDDGSAFSAKNPIVSQLPFENLLYTIGYETDSSDPSGNSIIIDIGAPEGYRQSALTQLRQWGFDPTDFKIKFEDYTNPFTL